MKRHHEAHEGHEGGRSAELRFIAPKITEREAQARELLALMGDGYKDDFLWFDVLTDREVAVLYYRFVVGETLKETGAKVLNTVKKPTSAERIRQLQNSGLHKLWRELRKP